MGSLLLNTLVSSQTGGKENTLGALIAQQMSRLENHKASITAKENLLCLTATEPIQLKCQTSHWIVWVAEL